MGNFSSEASVVKSDRLTQTPFSMKRFLSLSSILVMAFVSTAMVFQTPTNDLVYMDFEDFDSVSIGGSFEGTITQGNDFKTSVEVDDDARDYLVYKVVDRRLQIGFKNLPNGYSRNASFEVVMPDLKKVSVSGASSVEIAGFERSGKFSVHVSGSSRLEGDSSSDLLDAHVSGSSQLDLDGEAQDISLNLSGASRVDLEDLEAKDLELSISGASHAKVNVSGMVEGVASGASTIDCTRDPKSVNVKTSGAAKVCQ